MRSGYTNSDDLLVILLTNFSSFRSEVLRSYHVADVLLGGPVVEKVVIERPLHIPAADSEDCDEEDDQESSKHPGHLQFLLVSRVV